VRLRVGLTILGWEVRRLAMILLARSSFLRTDSERERNLLGLVHHVECRCGELDHVLSNNKAPLAVLFE